MQLPLRERAYCGSRTEAEKVDGAHSFEHLRRGPRADVDADAVDSRKAHVGRLDAAR